MAQDDDNQELGLTTNKYLSIHERQKSVRTVAICVAVMFCVGIICWTAVKITEKPPWLVLSLGLIAPAGVIISLLKMWRFYIRTRNRRVVELEEAIDQDRSSTKLEENGGSPDDF